MSRLVCFKLFAVSIRLEFGLLKSTFAGLGLGRCWARYKSGVTLFPQEDAGFACVCMCCC